MMWLMEILRICLEECQRGLASVVYKFFDKKTSDGAVKSEIMSNQELH